MKHIIKTLLTILILSSNIAANQVLNWPQWRGPFMNGSYINSNTPVDLREESDNLKWKIELNGSGHSSPIIFEDKIFILSAKETGKLLPDSVDKPSKKDLNIAARLTNNSQIVTRKMQYLVSAMDRNNGEILWQKVAKEKIPPQLIHGKASWCSSSPVTDGQYLIALFGSAGLYCYDLEGNLIWEKDFGNLNIYWSFGEGASPTIFDNKVILNWDHEGQSFITALDITTGKEIWRTNKEERTSWSTPIVVNVNGQSVIVTSADNFSRGFDLETGKILWEVKGLSTNTIPTPISYKDDVIVASGLYAEIIQSINLKTAMDKEESENAVSWEKKGNGPYTPSILLHKDRIYTLKGNKGIISCLNPNSGEIIYGPERLPSIKEVFASPVAANKYIYVVGRRGNVVILDSGSKFKVVAQTKLNDNFDASPAIYQNQIFLKGHKYLYCFES